MSYLLVPMMVDIAVRAISFIFHEYYDLGYVKRNDLWIVVMNPTTPYGSVRHFEQAILHQTQIGEPDEKYGRVALSKAEISWRTGLPSHLVQQNAPYLLVRGNTKWGGSTVTPEGLVVACSGVEWYMDQHMSEIIASAIKALCIRDITTVMEDDEIVFLGD